VTAGLKAFEKYSLAKLLTSYKTIISPNTDWKLYEVK